MLRSVASMQGQELVDGSESTVDGIADACSGLTAEQWALPTGCPGWSVKDHVSHLVGSRVRAHHRRRAHPRTRRRISRTPQARSANTWSAMSTCAVALPAEAVLTEFVAVFLGRRAGAARRARGRVRRNSARGPMGSMTPLRRMLGIRVFDVWAHEQDIRRAVGPPRWLRHEAAAVSFDRCTAFAGAAMADRMPDGSTLVWELEGPYAGVHALVVRGRQGDAARHASCGPHGAPDRGSETFMVLCCGRSDACAPGRARRRRCRARRGRSSTIPAFTP